MTAVHIFGLIFALFRNCYQRLIRFSTFSVVFCGGWHIDPTTGCPLLKEILYRNSRSKVHYFWNLSFDLKSGTTECYVRMCLDWFVIIRRILDNVSFRIKELFGTKLEFRNKPKSWNKTSYWLEFSSLAYIILECFFFNHSFAILN
jgi:hypothetical protein